MILVARNLTVSATLDGESVPVIRDLSFALERGRVIGLVGESGAGKSMVGRTIAQLLPPGFAVTGGNLEFAGNDLVSMDAEERRALLGREIAFIPQEPLSALNPVLTIGSQFDEHLALHWMDASSAHGDLSLYHYAKEQYEATPVESHKPALLLTGRDLIDAGLKPGPRFKELLHQLEDAQLEGAIRTRDEAINMLRTLLAGRSI